MAVVGGRATGLRPPLLPQVQLVGVPLLVDRERDVLLLVSGDLGVRVDRVAHQDVEVVALLTDPVPDLEVVPVGLRLAGQRPRVLVAGEGEADRPALLRLRRGLEPAGRAVVAIATAPPVAVPAVGLQAADPLLHGQVVRAFRPDLALVRGALRVAATELAAATLANLDNDVAGLAGPRPEERRARGHLCGRNAEPEVLGLRLRVTRRREEPGDQRGRQRKPSQTWAYQDHGAIKARPRRPRHPGT